MERSSGISSGLASTFFDVRSFVSAIIHAKIGKRDGKISLKIQKPVNYHFTTFKAFEKREGGKIFRFLKEEKGGSEEKRIMNNE